MTGGLGGIYGNDRRRSSGHDAFVGLIMGFSTTSAVLGGVIIICYSISINSYFYSYYPSSEFKKYRESMIIGAIILIFGIVEFVIGVWAAICGCLMTCRCCETPEQIPVEMPTSSMERRLVNAINTC